MNIIAYKEGMDMWLIPIRYWESEYQIKKVTLLKTVSLDDRHVYAETPDDGPQYLPINRVFYRLENAEEARRLLTRLHELENEDGTEAWMDILHPEMREKA